MPEPHQLPPEAEAQVGTLGSADLVVAVAGMDGLEDTDSAITIVRAGLVRHFPGLRAVLLNVHGGGKVAAVSTDEAKVPVLDLPMSTGGDPGPRGAALRLVLQISQRLRARGCAVLGAEVTSLTPEWVGRLLGPVLNQDMDLVAPHYQRHPYSGVVTSGILYPLIRALYGRRVRYPLGAEFACSGRLVQRELASDSARGRPGALELRLLAGAVAGGQRICQAALGPRSVLHVDGAASPAAVLSGVLAPVFAEMERSAPLWQKIRGSTPVELLGTDDTSSLEPVAVDGKRLLDAFRLGQQNLPEVWGLVLPPGTLVELKRVARLPDADFRLADVLWARIVFDFSLAYRTRIMSRDHLMGALAPLYLAWFGSLHAEMADSSPSRLEDRLEQLCLQFEAEKPYLISRWRWPDRFNP